MDLLEKKYPYPVLTPQGDDYIKCKFDVIGECVKNVDKITLHLRVKLVSNTLQKLIDEEYAKIIVHVECSQSAYRNAFTILQKDGEVHSIEISSDDLSGRVTLCPFIVAQKDISEFKSDEFNPVYVGFSFPIVCGAVLAEGSQSSLFVNTANKDIDYSPDIFSIVPYTPEPNVVGKPVFIDTNSDKLILRLPKRMFDIYGVMRQSGSLNELLWSTLILPALVEGLERILGEIADEGDDCGMLDEYTWCQVLKERIMRMHKDAKKDLSKFLHKSSLFEIAQELIQFPIGDLFEKLYDMKENESEDGHEN